MMDTDWKRQLRREASVHHMCGENRDALEAVETKAEAIELYKKTIDWALEENYPALSTIRSIFADCEDEGVFVDKEFHGEVLNGHSVYVFHNCTGVVRTGLNIQKRIIPMMYFANGCDMEIRSAGPSGLEVRVPLYVFGANTVRAVPSEDLKCKTYKFDVK